MYIRSTITTTTTTTSDIGNVVNYFDLICVGTVGVRMQISHTRLDLLTVIREHKTYIPDQSSGCEWRENIY